MNMLKWLPASLLIGLLATTATAQTPALKFDAAVTAGSKLPRLHSLLVSRNGVLVLEKYYNGVGPTRLANIKSASKAVMSALVGIAIDRGLVKNVKEPIGS